MALSSTEHGLRDRLFAAGDLRRIVPVWKPIPYRGIQRYDLPDNGGMGFTIVTNCSSMTEPQLSPSSSPMTVSSTSNGVVAVKQNNPSCYLASSGGCPTPFAQPSCVFTVDELQQMRKLTSATFNEHFFNEILMNRLRKEKTKNRLNNADLLKDLQALSVQLANVTKNAELNIPVIVSFVADKIPEGWTGNGMTTDDLLCNGGSLCYVDAPSTQHNKALLYSVGRNNSRLVYLPISVDPSLPQLIRPDWTHRNSFKFKRKIHQVSSMKIRDKVFYGVRMDRKVSIGELAISSDDLMSFKHINYAKEPQNYITDLSLSPYIPEFLYVTECGCVKIHNLETGVVVDKYQKSTKRSQWWSCQFASHPRCFVFARRNAIMLRDRRATNKRNLTILRSPSLAVLRGEQFSCYANSTDMDILPHLHYVGSTHSLFLVDDRYPGHPVLIWKHQLKERPRLLSAQLWSSGGSFNEMEDAIFLSSRKSQESVAFHVRHSICFDGRTCEQLSVSVSPNLKIPSPKDLPAVLAEKSRECDSSSNLFLGLPLFGMCSIPLSSERRIALLYQTIDGNLYSQAFSHSDNQLRDGVFSEFCSLWTLNDEQLVNDTCQWLDKLCDEMRSRMLSLSLNSNTCEKPKRLDATKIFAELANNDLHSHFCPFCCNCELRNEDESDEVCPKCHMPVQSSRTLSRNVNMSQVTAGSFPTSTVADDVDISVPNYTIYSEQGKRIPNQNMTSAYDMIQNILDTWQDGYTDFDDMDVTMSTASCVSSQNIETADEWSGDDCNSTREFALNSTPSHHKTKSQMDAWDNALTLHSPIQSRRSQSGERGFVNYNLGSQGQSFTDENIIREVPIGIGHDVNSCTSTEWTSQQSVGFNDSLCYDDFSIGATDQFSDVIPPSQPIVRMPSTMDPCANHAKVTKVKPKRLSLAPSTPKNNKWKSCSSVSGF